MPKIAAGATNKNISIAPSGTGKVVVGTGAADATVQSDGDHNLILQTGNSTTGKIEIVDGANGNIDLTPNGTGEVDISKVDIDGGEVDGITLGTNSAVTEAQIDNINIDGNAITSTNEDGNIDLTPAGTGEVNISKVDIDSGAIDGTDVTVGSGKTLNVSAGSLTTSTAQKQAIIDGATIPAALPSQGGNANKILTTDATDASWTNALVALTSLKFTPAATVPTSPTPAAGSIYYDSNKSVLKVYDGTSWRLLPSPIATGGVISTYISAGVTYRVHTFLASGTFTIVSSFMTPDVLLVGAGAGGGAGAGAGDGAGGGGGGGVVFGTGRVMNPSEYTITIEGGGAEHTIGGDTIVTGLWNGTSGTLTATATGGGRGGNDAESGGDGGNGGGAGGSGSASHVKGSGTQANQLGTTSELTKAGPYDGGDPDLSYFMGGGGGGAGGHGQDGAGSGTSTPGGIPVQNAYRTGSDVPYGQGGVGIRNSTGSDGTANTGDGGAGGATAGRTGGSGIVVIRYII